MCCIMGYTGHDLPTAEQQKAKNRHQTLTKLCTVAGAILLFIGIVDLPDAIGVVAGYGFGVGGSNVFAAAAQIVPSLLFSARKRRTPSRQDTV